MHSEVTARWLPAKPCCYPPQPPCSSTTRRSIMCKAGIFPACFQALFGWEIKTNYPNQTLNAYFNQLVLWVFVSRLSNTSLPTYWNISYILGPHFLVSSSRKYLQASHTVLFIPSISSPSPPLPASLFKLPSMLLPTQSQRSDSDSC